MQRRRRYAELHCTTNFSFLQGKFEWQNNFRISTLQVHSTTLVHFLKTFKIIHKCLILDQNSLDLWVFFKKSIFSLLKNVNSRILLDFPFFVQFSRNDRNSVDPFFVNWFNILAARRISAPASERAYAKRKTPAEFEKEIFSTRKNECKMIKNLYKRIQRINFRELRFQKTWNLFIIKIIKLEILAEVTVTV